MEPIPKLPDPEICRTRRLYSTQYFLCLVHEPINCPYLNLVREFYICNHYLKDQFAVDDPK